jgi:GTP-binding protein
MAFVDQYTFKAQAGNGGDGVVRWRREKFRPNGGPSGGDGGRGGDVFVSGVRDIAMLGRITHKDSYHAENGEAGGSESCHGADGEHLIIKLPVGSVVTNTETGTVVELLVEDEPIRILKAGIGGYGNEHFKSSTNRKPFEATKGTEGEAGSFSVELKLIADIGLVGLPNAGKTSILNALTNANAKVGAYPFTTLDPNLGAYHKYIIADIPGLIEGASHGKGLGHKFLRHISRTSVILHCISLEQDNIVDTYDIVRNELASYGGIDTKKEFIVLTKTDLSSADEIKKRSIELEQERRIRVLAAVTILDDASIKDLGDSITKMLSENK